MPHPPTLPNGQPVKERIGLYGLPNAGKTHQLFTIAKWHQELGSDARFYGINTDNSWEVVYSNPDFSSLTNVEWTDCVSFNDAYEAVKAYNLRLRDQDWLCTDLQNHFWALVQDEYAQLKAKEAGLDLDDLGQLWLESGDTKTYPLKGWEWQTPNARYRTLTNNYILRGPGHRLILSHQDDILEPSSGMKEDDIAKQNRMIFRHIGVKPAGQKEDAGRWHTILHLHAPTGDPRERQTLATAREKWGMRKWLGTVDSGGQVKMRRGEVFQDFFLDYLVGIAGWTMD